MDATCTIQDSIHVFNLVHKYVSRILGTYHEAEEAGASINENHEYKQNEKNEHPFLNEQIRILL